MPAKIILILIVYFVVPHKMLSYMKREIVIQDISYDMSGRSCQRISFILASELTSSNICVVLHIVFTLKTEEWWKGSDFYPSSQGIKMSVYLRRVLYLLSFIESTFVVVALSYALASLFLVWWYLLKISLLKNQYTIN